MPPLPSDPPIGVFDSGIGGLSVLQALRAELPHEHFIYLADSGNAPYGEKGDDFVRQRSLAIARHLRQHHAIKALVVACNTATAAAIPALRAALPELPMVGVEPALKPAALASNTHHVGVLATRGTAQSSRFAYLLAQHGDHTRFSVQACDGLAHAIEQSTGTGASGAEAKSKTRALCARYTSALGEFGIKPGMMDTLVLGCTHYVFAQDALRALVGPEVRIIETGAAVARQTRRILEQAGLLHQEAAPSANQQNILLYTTGALPALQAAAQRWLALTPERCTTISLPKFS